MRRNKKSVFVAVGQVLVRYFVSEDSALVDTVEVYFLVGSDSRIIENRYRVVLVASD